MYEQIYPWVKEQLPRNGMFAGPAGSSAIGTVPFRLLGSEDVRRMYLRFHPGDRENADRFAALTQTPVSPAELQRRLMGADPMAGLVVEAMPVAAE